MQCTLVLDDTFNAISVLEGEQAVQNDRLAALESGMCFPNVFIAGGMLLDANGQLTDWQYLFGYDIGTGYVIQNSSPSGWYVDFAPDGLSAGFALLGIGPFTGTCLVPQPTVDPVNVPVNATTLNGF